jgi:small basic protein
MRWGIEHVHARRPNSSKFYYSIALFPATNVIFNDINTHLPSQSTPPYTFITETSLNAVLASYS